MSKIIKLWRVDLSKYLLSTYYTINNRSEKSVQLKCLRIVFKEMRNKINILYIKDWLTFSPN